ncbi:MAG TPA: hypothetical protein VN132_05200 [Bdellovibrio sp.]|nr:hypothetical protein [Bdellovibrio sp.]
MKKVLIVLAVMLSSVSAFSKDMSKAELEHYKDGIDYLMKMEAHAMNCAFLKENQGDAFTFIMDVIRDSFSVELSADGSQPFIKFTYIGKNTGYRYVTSITTSPDYKSVAQVDLSQESPNKKIVFSGDLKNNFTLENRTLYNLVTYATCKREK